MNIDTESINHFVNLAARGHHPAASGGEKIAAQVGKALAKIGDDLALLDADCIRGIRDLIFLMAGPWPTDKAKTTIYSMVRHAGGKRR